MFYALATRPATTIARAAAPLVSNTPVDRFLSDTFTSFTDGTFARSANVEDLENVYTLQLDVPGVPKEQLDIGIEGDVVRINSKAEAPRQVKAAWRFPLEIDTANSSAKLENGVLMLTLGKKIPASNVSPLLIS
jgi:HSP20 family molecular chaperone IbpA